MSYSPPQAPKPTGAPAPPPPAGKAAAAGVEEPSVRAVSVVLLNAYSKGAKRALTAFLVCEKGDEGEPMWTCPMGGRKFEPVAAQAAFTDAAFWSAPRYALTAADEREAARAAKKEKAKK